MSLTQQDLRAAVPAGIISETQAAQLIAFAEARRVAADRMSPAEEPFVLFKGFNEIFVVVGLSILFAGWCGVAMLMGLDMDAPTGSVTVLLSLVTLAGLAALGRYFTLTRRMIAPSIALVVMVAMTAVVLAFALLGAEPGWAALFVAVLMAGHYAVFRVPFSAVIIAGAGFFALWAGLAALGWVDDTKVTFSNSIDGPFSLMTIAFGLAVFALAMRLDLSDPHRISTRSATAFWLHVVAAPAIVNTVALNLLKDGGAVAQVWLLAFLLIIAVVAIVIDRRSFLVSGAGYSVALAAMLFEGGAAVAILILGLALVLLGALWERLRARLMRALPDFPGKTNLPPYGSA